MKKLMSQQINRMVETMGKLEADYTAELLPPDNTNQSEKVSEGFRKTPSLVKTKI